MFLFGFVHRITLHLLLNQNFSENFVLPKDFIKASAGARLINLRSIGKDFNLWQFLNAVVERQRNLLLASVV